MKFQLFDVLDTHLFNMGTMSLVLLFIFAIIVVGYLIGKISIKGISLGSAAIFLTAIVAGHFYQVGVDNIPEWAESNASVESYLEMTEKFGLIFFVTSVGLIAGPTFFKNFVKNFKSYVLLGLIIIVAGAGTCALIIMFAPNMTTEIGVGLLSGALTSTPAFATATEILTESKAEVAVGQAVAYPFGVIGVVLFVQLIPKILHADMEKERQLIKIGDADTKKSEGKKYFEMDKFGIAAFGLTVVAGLILGSINIPLGRGQSFNLGQTGGPLIMGLIFGHFGHIGKLSLKVKKEVVSFCQELGLILFLTGAGIAGGREFVSTLVEYGAILFLYGALITIIPLVIGFILAKFVFKMPLLNSLGSLTGGMTSTPALGALINVAGTSNVASAYASTYPIALIAVVLSAQLLTHVHNLM